MQYYFLLIKVSQIIHSCWVKVQVIYFIFRCPADPDLGVVVELQLSGGPASDYDKHSLITRAWVKVPLFDNDGKLISGKFRIPFRNVPIKPFLHASELQKLEKVGELSPFAYCITLKPNPK